MTVIIKPIKAHSIHAGKYEPKIFCVGDELGGINVNNTSLSIRGLHLPFITYASIINIKHHDQCDLLSLSKSTGINSIFYLDFPKLSKFYLRVIKSDQGCNSAFTKITLFK